MDTAWEELTVGVGGWREMDERCPWDTVGLFLCITQGAAGWPPVFSCGCPTDEGSLV